MTNAMSNTFEVSRHGRRESIEYGKTRFAWLAGAKHARQAQDGSESQSAEDADQ